MPVVETCQSHCLVGIGRCDITPPIGIYHRMWGAATHDRSTGVHRPLTATVIHLRESGSIAPCQRIIIAVDHCLLWTQEMNGLLNSICTNLDIPADQLIVFFSHTHGAGLMGLERSKLPGGDLISPYLDELAQKITGLITSTGRNLQSATIVYGSGKCRLATNRDFYDDVREQYVCGFNPDGVADDTVMVARITDDSDRILATLVNYACHPTTLGWDNTLISPDYVGAMREVVEAATGAPCFFIQGASGDIGPREGFVGDTEVADRNGRQLGYAALATIEGLPPANQSYHYLRPVVSGATIGVWEYQAESDQRTQQTAAWCERRNVVPLAYRHDLPCRADLDRELAEWTRIEERARISGQLVEANEARAMIERATRRLTRVASLPPGKTYPYPIVGWRIGDAVWLAFDGEHYNTLQRTLRDRFPKTPLIIGTIANGSNVWYLPDAASYGKGLYQEEVAVLEQGCLEQVIEAATGLIRELISGSGS